MATVLVQQPPPPPLPVALSSSLSPPLPKDLSHAIRSNQLPSPRSSPHPTGFPARVRDERMSMDPTEESLTRFALATSSKHPQASLHSPVDQVTCTPCGPELVEQHVHKFHDGPPGYEEIPPSSFSDPGHYEITRSSLASPPPSHTMHTMRPLPPVPDSFLDYYRAANDVVGSPSSSATTSPPPLPPKSDRRYKSKTVSIVTPSDYSHHDPEPIYTASEPDHSSVHPTHSDRPPSRNLYGAHVSAGLSPLSSRLSWADKAHVPLYSNSCPSSAMNAPTAVPFPVPESLPRQGHNRLRKAPLRPRPSLPPPSSFAPRPVSRFWRALSLHGHCSSSQLSSQPGLSSRPSQSSQSNGHSQETHSSPTARPFPRTSNSGSDSSAGHNSCTSTSTHLTTPLTTPDSSSPPTSPIILDSPEQAPFGSQTHSAISPIVLPQLSNSPSRPRKLKKKRPPTAPSATSHLLLDSTNSQRSIGRNAGEFHDLIPPVSPEAPFGLGIPKGLKVQTTTVPILSSLETKHSSSHALAELAMTGVCSSSFAAFASRLSIATHSPERASRFISDGDGVEVFPATFDPYSEYSPYEHAILPPGTQITDNPQSYSPTSRRPAVPGAMVLSSSRSSCASANHIDADVLARGAVNLDRSATATMRRWTLAMSDVSDEVLVQELDRLRKDTGRRAAKSRRGSHSGHGHEGASKTVRERTHSIVYGVSTDGRCDWGQGGAHFRLGDDSDSEDEDEDGTVEEVYEGDDPEVEQEWKTARRALLACRELMRTERNYQARLRQLLAAESSHPLFPLLLSYVPPLLAASEALLVRFMDDPSAWGVSTAFIGCEEELESALVAWCGVIGDFFDGDEGGGMKRGRKAVRREPEEMVVPAPRLEGTRRSISRAFRASSRSPSAAHLVGAKPRAPERPMSMFVEGPTHPNGLGMFTSALGTGLALGISPFAPASPPTTYQSSADVRRVPNQRTGATISRTLSAWRRKSMPSSLSNIPAVQPLSSSVVTQAKADPEKRLTVRDLAIQPTQRVTRYVLQYRELLDHTPPSSPARGLVERALEGAIRIAKKCDRAQGNSAFLRRI